MFKITLYVISNFCELFQISYFGMINICGKFQPLDGKGLSDEWECQHGVGHGILQHQRVLLQRTALRQALQICEQSSTDTEPCQNGIWMDYWVNIGMTMDRDGAKYRPLIIRECPTGGSVPVVTVVSKGRESK